MEMLGRIRRMYMRDKVSLHEIAKRTGLSRNTVRSWLRKPEEVKEPVYSRTAGFNKLNAYVAELEQSLKADAHRPKQNRRTARALFAQIKTSGYEGGYTRVTDFIRAWRVDAGKDARAFVPLKFEMGEAFQFDWSEEGLVVGGIYHRMQVSHMKLCASRAFWLVAYPSQGHEMLFDAHTRSFAALGGVARRGIYDNMKTAVDKVPRGKGGQGGKGRIVNARFAVMCAHYLFDADFCNVASGWEKGVVEKNVQDICYDWQHYIALIQRKSGALRNGAPFADMPTPLQRLRQGLMRHEGGEKTMAQVLNCVSSHGLEAVLVAVELVIESGALSTEHVLNVLARLDAPEPPPNIESTLDLKEAPLADTGRYDSLRGDAMEGVSHA